MRPRLAGMTFDVVLCSDLQRCLDTAAIALEGIDCTLIKEPLLRERDLGNLAGTPIKGAVLNETVETEEAPLEVPAEVVIANAEAMEA